MDTQISEIEGEMLDVEFNNSVSRINSAMKDLPSNVELFPHVKLEQGGESAFVDFAIADDYSCRLLYVPRKKDLGTINAFMSKVSELCLAQRILRCLEPDSIVDIGIVAVASRLLEVEKFLKDSHIQNDELKLIDSDGFLPLVRTEFAKNDKETAVVLKKNGDETVVSLKQYAGGILPPVAWEIKQSLVRVVVAAGVVEISEDAFADCDNMTSITIPKSVRTIGKNAFSDYASRSAAAWIAVPDEGSKLENVYVEDISAWCEIDFKGKPFFHDHHIFESGKLVTHLKIPHGVQRIGKGAFAHCMDIVSVEIPSSVSEIGEEAFANCHNLNSVVIIGASTPCGNKLHVANRAFGGCFHLSSIEIYSQEIELGCEVLNYCENNLVEIKFGKDASKIVISPDTFRSCVSLSNIAIDAHITVDEANSTYKFEKNLLMTKDGRRIIRGIGVVGILDIPHTVSIIEQDAFYGCDKLIGVIFPKALTSIGERAFSGCRALEEISIQGNGVVIGDRSFEACQQLRRVTMLCGVKRVGYAAFRDCKNLDKVSIPDGVESIGHDCFRGCAEGLVQKESIKGSLAEVVDGWIVEIYPMHVKGVDPYYLGYFLYPFGTNREVGPLAKEFEPYRGVAEGAYRPNDFEIEAWQCARANADWHNQE